MFMRYIFVLLFALFSCDCRSGQFVVLVATIFNDGTGAMTGHVDYTSDGTHYSNAPCTHMGGIGDQSGVGSFYPTIYPGGFADFQVSYVLSNPGLSKARVVYLAWSGLSGGSGYQEVSIYGGNAHFFPGGAVTWTNYSAEVCNGSGYSAMAYWKLNGTTMYSEQLGPGQCGTYQYNYPNYGNTSLDFGYTQTTTTASTGADGNLAVSSSSQDWGTNVLPGVDGGNSSAWSGTNGMAVKNASDLWGTNSTDNLLVSINAYNGDLLAEAKKANGFLSIIANKNSDNPTISSNFVYYSNNTWYSNIANFYYSNNTWYTNSVTITNLLSNSVLVTNISGNVTNYWTQDAVSVMTNWPAAGRSASNLAPSMSADHNAAVAAAGTALSEFAATADSNAVVRAPSFPTGDASQAIVDIHAGAFIFHIDLLNNTLSPVMDVAHSLFEFIIAFYALWLILRELPPAIKFAMAGRGVEVPNMMYLVLGTGGNPGVFFWATLVAVVVLLYSVICSDLAHLAVDGFAWGLFSSVLSSDVLGSAGAGAMAVLLKIFPLQYFLATMVGYFLWKWTLYKYAVVYRVAKTFIAGS